MPITPVDPLLEEPIEEDTTPVQAQVRSSRMQIHSFAAQVRALGLGDTASKVYRVSGHITLAMLKAELPRIREALRANVRATTKRAEEALPGTQYEIEVSETLTTSYNFYLVAIVTRTA